MEITFAIYSLYSASKAVKLNGDGRTIDSKCCRAETGLARLSG
jgi:hypothetical protein